MVSGTTEFVSIKIEKDEAESTKDKVELSPIAQLVRALH